MPFTIEDASVRNLEELHVIETECFDQEAFTKQQIAELLRDYNSISLLVKRDCETVGFIIGRIDIERKAMAGHISTIDVSPKYRRRGIGKLLLAEMEKIFKQKGVKTCYLEVREDNAAGDQSL